MFLGRVLGDGFFVRLVLACGRYVWMWKMGGMGSSVICGGAIYS